MGAVSIVHGTSTQLYITTKHPVAPGNPRLIYVTLSIHVCILNLHVSSVFNPFMTHICPQELNAFRSKCGMLFHYDWISIPLVYTQVTSLCLHLCLV